MQRCGWSAIPRWCQWATIAAAAVTCPMLAFAQVSTSASPAPPAVPVPSTAAQPSQFVPWGWVLEQQKIADLNGDGRDDALLLIRKSDSGRTPQRILAVVLRQPNGYALAEMNSRLIPHGDNIDQEDPMADGELTAQPGGFDVKLTLMSGAGSYEMATLLYHFRYQDGCFRLIGYDRMETNRATLDTNDLSVNFLTGAVTHRTGNAQSDATREKSDRLKTNSRLCFGDLDNAAVFHPQ
jgi:hypothetical protein